MIKIIQAFKPRIAAWLTVSVSGVGLLVQFLTRRSVGLLLIALLIYWLATYGESQPFSSGEMLLWLDSLPTEAKSSALASILTIAGFLVAFSAASENLKTQARLQIKLSAATELHAFFSEMGRLAVQVEIYAKLLVRTLDFAIAHGDTGETQWRVKYAVDQTDDFLAVQKRLSAMSIDVHLLRGKYYTMLNNEIGLIDALEQAIEASQKMANDMWFSVPRFDSASPGTVGLFCHSIKADECQRFIDAYDENYNAMNSLIGAIKGSLEAAVFPFKFTSWIGLVKRRAMLEDAFFAIRRRK